MYVAHGYVKGRSSDVDGESELKFKCSREDYDPCSAIGKTTGVVLTLIVLTPEEAQDPKWKAVLKHGGDAQH